MTIKLLAVDDSKTMRRVLEITFSGEEFDTTLAANADEALNGLGSNPPDIAVVDGYLGGSSGYDLCKEIKSRVPNVQCVLLSSKQRPFDAGQASASGVDDHFDKPFDSGKFIEKIKQLSDSAEKPAAARPAAAKPAAPKPATPKPAPAAAKPAAASPSMPSRPQRPQAPPARTSAAPPQVGSPSRSPAKPAASAGTPAAPVAKPPTTPAAPAAKPAAAKPAAAPARATSNQAKADQAVAAASGDLESKLKDLGLTSHQMEGVLALSREVVEQVVWEVVPQLAETMIKEEIDRLTAE